jgi:hypothetical protein
MLFTMQALSVFLLCRKHHLLAREGDIDLPLPKNPKVPAEECPRGRCCRPRSEAVKEDVCRVFTG